MILVVVLMMVDMVDKGHEPKLVADGVDGLGEGDRGDGGGGTSGDRDG